MTDAPVLHSQPNLLELRQFVPTLDREIWSSCNLCGGEGGWEEARPMWDDPFFSISIKCPSCGGTGWECS